MSLSLCLLSHWGRVTHICVSKLTIIGSDNGLSPGRRQAIIWTNAEILLIGPLGINFNEILIAIEAFSFKKMHLKISAAKWRPFCLGLNVLISNNSSDIYFIHSYISCWLCDKLWFYWAQTSPFICSAKQWLGQWLHTCTWVCMSEEEYPAYLHNGCA